MARRKIVKDNEGNPVELDQDKIEAALAGAVTMADGSHLKTNEEERYSPMDGKKKNKENLDDSEENIHPPTDNEKLDEDLMSVGTDVDDEVTENNSQTSETPPIAMNQQQFVDACYNLNINAKQCKYQSSKVEDKSIVEYIRSINKKIYDETQKGGYSTNVQFRVTPQDWVNVNHIFEWYRVRGFQVDVKEATSAPYGKEVGTINYNFTISWVDA